MLGLCSSNLLWSVGGAGGHLCFNRRNGAWDQMENVVALLTEMPSTS